MSLPRAWLIYIGSAENNFEDAGSLWSLDGIRVLQFGRGKGEHITADSADGSMHINIPLGWVSQAHAEMRIVSAGPNLEFDLRDLGSRNGSLIERQPIPGIARLKVGQILEIGRSFWMVQPVIPKDLPPEPTCLEGTLGSSNPRLCLTHRTLARLATSDVPLLLRGETGTGKELTARAIHRLSGRKGQFVASNLAALSENRIDSVLFGHRKGAFPGAGEDRPGIFELADGGTLFLDELGELPPNIQSKLHAALAEGRVQRIGEERPRDFDVRIIASSLHDLQSMVEEKLFRPDLYSRLAGFEAELPPLRYRREDLGLLTLSLCQTRESSAPARLTTRAFRRILSHNWPFNVRELDQTLATASILAGSGGQITHEVLEEILERRQDMPQSPETVSQLRTQLVNQLAKSGGDTAEVARALDRDQKEIHRWLERFELQPDAYRS